ncbi:hypothetical protein AB0E78_40190 [Streptomyces sp. NPDC032198]|uniref:terpene synthase family protein n=1 Tax=Streptomyces sp. NPDC032198 TaxID=3155127 RepID=UPI0033E4A133
MTPIPPAVSDPTIAALLAFHCPLEEEVSPESDQLLDRTLAWAKHHRLGTTDEQTAMFAMTGATFAAHMYPHTRGETAQAFSDYDAWGWAANERVGSATRTCDIVADLGRWERIMHSPASWPHSADPLDTALSDAFTRLRTHLTPVQWERFTTGQGQWLYSMGWEAALRERGTPLGVNDYLAMRIGAGGCYSAAYLDGTENTNLSEHHWANPTLRATVEAGMLTALLDNDRYSYLREHRLAVRKHNLFDALRTEHPHYTFDQAATAAIALRDRIMTLYLRLRKQQLKNAPHDVRRYLTGVDRVLSGNITFAATAVRYLLPDLPHTVTRTSQPTDSTTGAPDLPTIAWWWNQLTP